MRRSASRGPALAANLVNAFVDQRRAAIDQARIQLHQRGAGIEFLGCVTAIQDATHADQRNAPLQTLVHAGQHRGGVCEQRLAGKSARLVAVRIVGHGAVVDGGVAADHAVDAGVQQYLGDGVLLGLVQIGRDLQQHGFALAVLGAQSLLRLAQYRDEAPQRGFLLQVAQALRVGRGDIDGDVAGVLVHAGEAEQVIAGGFLVRRVLVLADVDAEHAVVAGLLHVAHQRVDAGVVEAEPVDDRLVVLQAEHPRLRVARLRPRRGGAHFDEAEAERAERVEVVGVLVQPRGQADRVGKAQPERFHRQVLRRPRDEAQQVAAVGHVQAVEGQPVRGLRIEREQQGAQVRIHGQSRVPT